MEEWDATKMPSQRGKIAVVTGANTGIGYYTALALASHGAHVVLACRNKERGEKAVDEMKAVLAEVSTDVRGSVELMLLDLDCLKNVRDFAEELRRKFHRLDLLINNGGATMSLEPLTSDGFETHYGVNHLAHFYLTAFLFELIKASSAARVVNVSSVAHRGMKIDFETIQKGAGPVWMRYGQSKLANLLFTYELGRQLDEANITNVMSVAAHPGVSRTEGMDKTIEYIFPSFLHGAAKSLTSWIPIQPPSVGALSILYAATAEDVKNKEYFGPARFGGRYGHPAREISDATSRSEVLAQELWAFSEELTEHPFAVSA